MYANIMNERTTVEASGNGTLSRRVVERRDIIFQVKPSNCPLHRNEYVVVWILDTTHFDNRPLYNQVFNSIPQRLLTVLAGKVLCQRPQR